MRLHLWTGDDVDNLLAGQAAVLRTTYFGELVLTPELLGQRHEHAVASIRARWQPDVHHVGEAERDLRRMLGEAESWDVVRAMPAVLRSSADSVDSATPVPSSLSLLVSDVLTSSRQLASFLEGIAEGISNGDLDLLRDELDVRLRGLPKDVATAPRRLRSGNHRAALYVTNAVAACHEAIRVLTDVEAALESRVVAVLAPAGCGKTHLAAQLTANTTARPHGVLLHGRDLHANHTLDDLARRMSIAANPVPSMEALIAAVNSAGQRAGHRLPVVIDGLNEAEDPRQWKPLLASLEVLLGSYPYVLLVCTLRPEFVEDALPDETRRVEVEGYGDETAEAVREHFRYWKIDATDASLPEFLRHPLTLRLFCEVTNPNRQSTVGVSAMPGSLTALFDRYLEQVVIRVVELAPRQHRFYAQDVNSAISTIANALWESNARSVSIGELRNTLGDSQRPWDQSLVRALEHEGVFLRMPSTDGDTVIPVYDLLGGHIIASALLTKHGRATFETWIKESSTNSALAGAYSVRHPLADDIVLSLVGQVPRRFLAKQLWQLVDEPLRGRTLRAAARLEPVFLDAATVDALLDLVRGGDATLLGRLWEVRGTPAHPLNADALDHTLRTMSVADRDLRWTEWLRANQDDAPRRGRNVRRDLEQLERRWRQGQARDGDRLRARWAMWTLTSTVRALRDQATRTLYWFGRLDAGCLFRLTIDSLSVNDAYVVERMLAASYGVVMSRSIADANFSALLTPFLEQLAAGLVGPLATAPARHYLGRLYAQGTAAFVAIFHSSSLPLSMKGIWAFGAPAPVAPLVSGAPEAEEAGQALQMDFENYTLGRLFDDRDNYNMNHPGHQAAVAYVRGVVWALGWRQSNFDSVDGSIAESRYRGNPTGRAVAERYGKKYGRIGFYEYAGLLAERGHFERLEFSDVDIDPTFPEKPPADSKSSTVEAWLSPSTESHEHWMRDGIRAVPRGLLRREMIGEHRGPWVAVHGFVKAADRVLGREAWAFISAFVVDQSNAQTLSEALRAGTRPLAARDAPREYSLFAGEIPWHPNFAAKYLTEGAYQEELRIGPTRVSIEMLAHRYAWDRSHSDMNHVEDARVPSQRFSHRFDLRGAAQTFDQFMPDGSRATITVSGVDGLEGDVLYFREDLLWQYVGDRSVAWYGFGERELRPYPPSPPQWLVDIDRRSVSSWYEVLTRDDIEPDSRPSGVSNDRS